MSEVVAITLTDEEVAALEVWARSNIAESDDWLDSVLRKCWGALPVEAGQ